MAYGWTPVDLGFAQEPDLITDPGATWDESVAIAARLWRQDVDRRDFLTSSVFTTAAFAAPTLHALVSNADASPARASGRVSVGAFHLAFIQDITKHFGSLDNRYGGGQVRRSTVAFLDGEVRR